MGIDAQLLVKTKFKVNEGMVLRWAYDLAYAFGSEQFFMIKPNQAKKYGDAPRHCLSIIDEYTQDGDSLFPKKGETFIAVHLFTRYYGEGYERGDLPFIISVADWVKRNIPESEIWYGGDSSGVLAEPFDKKARELAWQHFCRVGRKPYVEAFDHLEGIVPLVCELCKKPMLRKGWGNKGKYVLLVCPGCGTQMESNDKGETYEEREQ